MVIKPATIRPCRKFCWPLFSGYGLEGLLQPQQSLHWAIHPFSPSNSFNWRCCSDIALRRAVIAVCPGVVETDMTRSGFAVEGDADEAIRRQHLAYPLNRIRTLEEAAAALGYVAHRRQRRVSGRLSKVV